ncbi:hypothetical protein HAD_13004 [Hyphomonas adhaerens MHS-3]|uniref:Uncharacterized protein n=1 Tax=Hyphomonas adhaerens MHS-3 TaxID=1280949 RepID=A0A069E1W1_9PROT|nr:hypothetical protein [Hyphomonas adhaerens]KCZ83523.1 hypothetical protein HAD_13004 [Hyphomonas adhaerens MHS-3]
MQLAMFNQRGIEAFEALIETARDNVDARKPALVDDAFFSAVDAIAVDPEMTTIVSHEIEIDAGLQFKDRFEMGEYLSENLPTDLAVVQHTNIGLWAWISAIYLRQLLEKPPKGGEWKLWSAYRYIPREYQKFRYYRHLAFMSFWLHRSFGEEVAKFFLSRPPYAHSDAIEQLYTQDRDFLASRGLMKAAVEMYIDPKTGTMKRNALGKATPGSARRLATKIAKQLQMNYDLYSMSKADIYALLPSEFDSWRPSSEKAPF